MKPGVILDLDGTLLDGNMAYAGAAALMKRLQEAGVPILVMTNSVQSPEMIAKRLAACDIEVRIQSILNPIVAMNAYIEKQGWSAVRCIGSEAERNQLVRASNSDRPDAIALLDFEDINADYQLLQELMTQWHEGVPLIAASGSCHYTKNGMRHIDTGAFVKLLEFAANAQMPILGKPSALYFQMAYRLLDRPAEAVYIVGDDVSTDMQGAASTGAAGCLIKTGKYQSGDAAHANVTFSFDGLADFEQMYFDAVASSALPAYNKSDAKNG
jgi:HAD superfamily hydrolase (TIGR01450 family)